MALWQYIATYATVIFILLGGHRPFYCVPSGGKDCGDFATYMRDCLEDVFHLYKVDLVVNAHMHNYEVSFCRLMQFSSI